MSSNRRRRGAGDPGVAEPIPADPMLAALEPAAGARGAAEADPDGGSVDDGVAPSPGEGVLLQPPPRQTSAMEIPESRRTMARASYAPTSK